MGIRVSERARAGASVDAVVRPRRNRACIDGTALPRLGSRDEVEEREADRVAEAVLCAGTAPARLRKTPALSGGIGARGEAPAVRLPQRRRTSASSVAGGGVAIAQATAALAGGGRALPASTRAWFEPRFGVDLSQVRIHDDGEAGRAAGAINARAYTLGFDIGFAPGEFAPHTPAGRHLLAHEITHTLQQRHRSRVLRRDPAPGPSAPQPTGLAPGRLTLWQARMEMCRRDDTRAILERIDADNVEIRLFSRAEDRWRLDDGTIEVVDLSARLRGNRATDPATGNTIIRLNARLGVNDMVETLFHEMQHHVHRQDPAGPRGLESEIQARIATEQMAIDRGWPPTRTGYRTPDGRVDEAFIRQEIQSSSHYNPQGRTRIGRTYGGEDTVQGPFACPPVGDFPLPSGTERYA